MKKKNFLFSIWVVGAILLGLTFKSCTKNEYYSCDPVVDNIVKLNKTKAINMTISEWEKTSPQAQKAIYLTFSPEKKREVWLHKIEQTLKLDWNGNEISHIEKLESFIENTHDLFDDEPTDANLDHLKLFAVEWMDYAKEVLK